MKGSRARTPRPRVVWPSKLPAQATCLNVLYFETLLTSERFAGAKVALPVALS